VQPYFQKFKNNLELDPTFAEKVSTRHNAVREYLQNNHPGYKDAKLIGSLQRKTRINPGTTGKFDIDMIVVMGEFTHWLPAGQGLTPQVAIASLHATVEASARYNAMEPVPDAPAVTLTGADDIQVQLVPAYVDKIGRDSQGRELGSMGRGYWVAKGNSWYIADYDHEADWISNTNVISVGHLIPAIKMLKAIKRLYFPSLESFPLEIVAAALLPEFIIGKEMGNEPIFYQDMVLTFFERASGYLSNPIQIPGSKSLPIRLTLAHASQLANKFSQIVQYIKGTATLGAEKDRVERWRKLCGDQFPATL